MTSLRFSRLATCPLRDLLGYVAPRDALLDPRGRTVRCTPWRRTIRHEFPGGSCAFRKLRGRRPNDAEREWRALHELADAGFHVPEPVFFARDGGRTAIGTRAVSGRPLDALLASRRHDRASAGERAAVAAALLVRRLHAHGWCHRDMYWNHLFAADLDRLDAIAIIDVERVFRPRVRIRRWRVKDLAALVASWPASLEVDAEFWPRFVAAYDDGSAVRDRRLCADVLAKAQRIRAHAPRYG